MTIHISGTEKDINHDRYPITLILDGSSSSNGRIPLKINSHSAINTIAVTDVMTIIFLMIFDLSI